MCKLEYFNSQKYCIDYNNSMRLACAYETCVHMFLRSHFRHVWWVRNASCCPMAIHWADVKVAAERTFREIEYQSFTMWQERISSGGIAMYHQGSNLHATYINVAIWTISMTIGIGLNVYQLLLISNYQCTAKFHTRCQYK